MAQLCISCGRITDGMRYLARAGLLLETTTRRSDWYLLAMSSYGDAAMAAGLIEVAAASYDEHYAGRGSNNAGYFECVYGNLLASWGLWLEYVGHSFEAGHRWRRLAQPRRPASRTSTPRRSDRPSRGRSGRGVGGPAAAKEVDVVHEAVAQVA